VKFVNVSDNPGTASPLDFFECCAHNGKAC
jgi:hypothetical protein